MRRLQLLERRNGELLMTDIPRSSTETLISATRIVANWHRRAVFDATTEADAADHVIHAEALAEAADRLGELNDALSSRLPPGSPATPHPGDHDEQS